MFLIKNALSTILFPTFRRETTWAVSQRVSAKTKSKDFVQFSLPVAAKHSKTYFTTFIFSKGSGQYPFPCSRGLFQKYFPQSKKTFLQNQNRIFCPKSHPKIRTNPDTHRLGSYQHFMLIAAPKNKRLKKYIFATNLILIHCRQSCHFILEWWVVLLRQNSSSTFNNKQLN